MLKSKEGEEIGAEILNGDVYDTRRKIGYSKIAKNIEKWQDESERTSLNQKSPSKSSFLKMKCILDKGTELRNKYTGEDLNKIPFDCFVENGNYAYFIEIKTNTKSDSNRFSFCETELLGMAATKICKIPLYIIHFYAQNIDLKEYVPKFELMEIGKYILPRPSRNFESNRRMLNSRNPFNFDFCNEETCKKVIKNEYQDIILNKEY